MSSGSARFVGCPRILVAFLPVLLLWGTPGSTASEPTPIGPKEIAHLIERIDTYHRLLEEKRYADAYRMIGSEWRGGEKDEKEWIEYQKSSERGMRVVSWHIKRMWISGKRARVRMVLEGSLRAGLLARKDDVMEEYDFWELEQEGWYRIPFRTPHWDESKAVEVALPGPSPATDPNTAANGGTGPPPPLSPPLR